MAEDQIISKLKDKSSFRPVLLVDHPGLKDYQACLQHLFVGLADSSFQSGLICPPDGRAGTVLCPSVELIYHPLLRLPIFRSQNRRLVLDKLNKFKPTVLHCFSSGKARLTKFLAESLDIPFILTFNSYNRKHIKDVVYSPNCASLLALSRSVGEHLENTYKRFSGNIAQLNTGTFVEDTCACFSRPSQITSMVVAQPFSNAGDFEGLLGAVRHLAIDGYEFILALIGKGSAERVMHRMIRDFDLSQIVTVVPDIQPLRSIFSGADIFIQPHYRPEYNSSLLEAMGVGMVVASCHDGSDDLIIDNQTAVTFDAYDELSVYSCLQKLLDTKEFARQIATGAQEHLRKNYTVSNMVTSLLGFYSDSQKWYKEDSKALAESSVS